MSHRPLAMHDGLARQADWSDLGALAAFGNGWNFGQGASGLGAATVQVDGAGGGFGSQGFERLSFVRD